MIVIKEQPGQTTWLDLKLPDLRTLDVLFTTPIPDECPAGRDHSEGCAVLERAFGFSSNVDSIIFKSAYQDVTVQRSAISHIAEKRQDARERYVLAAIDTINHPFEVWKVKYDDGSFRLAFISAYAAKTQLLVVATWQGQFLWNFMQCEAKKLNKHRHGEVVYQRYLASIKKAEKENGSAILV
jgi:hypothetical protein